MKFLTCQMNIQLEEFQGASDGTVAYVMKLIRYGTYLALQNHKEKLDLKLLSIAFEKYVHDDKTDKVNPFSIDDFDVELVNKSSSVEVGATNNRLKSKSKKMSVNYVLRNN